MEKKKSDKYREFLTRIATNENNKKMNIIMHNIWLYVIGFDMSLQAGQEKVYGDGSCW